MSSLSHVHVEVAIKDEFAAARRQIEALAQHATWPFEPLAMRYSGLVEAH
jgi:hypothetical protein